MTNTDPERMALESLNEFFRFTNTTLLTELTISQLKGNVYMSDYKTFMDWVFSRSIWLVFFGHDAEHLFLLWSDPDYGFQK
jgi:hypothetical protein